MDFVQYSVRDRIGFIVLNRPEKRNALNYELVTELKDSFTRAEADPNVKVIILKATGETFCAGADLEYLRVMQKFSLEQNRTDSDHLKSLYLQIYTLKKVVVAQVQGHALAGGCGLATICDFCFSVPEARFGYTEVKIGFVPAIVMMFLLRKVGEAHAKELLLTGDLITAAEAMRLGLINRVVEKQKLDETVLEFVKQLISTNSANSMRLIKQMIAAMQSMKLEEGLNYASEMNASARMMDDCRRGIEAFINKQRIIW